MPNKKIKQVIVLCMVAYFILPVSAFGEEDFSVQYYENESSYLAGKGGIDAVPSFFQTTQSEMPEIEQNQEMQTNEFDEDTIVANDAAPQTNLWSDEPIIDTVTANQYRNKRRYPKQPIRIIINGKQYMPKDVQPLIIEDRVFVPLRFVAEQIGYTVSWDAATMTAEINDGAVEIEAGSYTMRKYDEFTVPSDTPAFIHQGTLMVGLRQIGNALNYRVHWDSKHRIVYMERARQ